MRKLKFRAWDTQFECMYDNIEEVDCIFAEYARNPDMRVMQFTGLQDSKGVDIYEGDIVQDMDNPDGKPHAVIAESACEWKWGQYGHIHEALTYCARTFHVLGNIFEHPHLLNREATEVPRKGDK